MMSDLPVLGLIMVNLCGDSLLRKTEGGQAYDEDRNWLLLCAASQTCR